MIGATARFRICSLVLFCSYKLGEFEKVPGLPQVAHFNVERWYDTSDIAVSVAQSRQLPYVPFK
jgi:hypothetical protein